MKTEVVLETRAGRTLSKRTEYYNDGTMFRQGTYSQAHGAWSYDIPIGLIKTFNPNGTICSEEMYDSTGTKSGESNYYQKDGLLIKRIVYDNGKKISETDFEVPKNKPATQR
jgi:antitoxin component YwqK of YwqJK toxin-antitoxin module